MCIPMQAHSHTHTSEYECRHAYAHDSHKNGLKSIISEINFNVQINP